MFFVTEVLLITVLGTNMALLFFIAGWYFGPSSDLDQPAVSPIVAILKEQWAKWRQTNSSMSCWKQRWRHSQEEPGPTQGSVRCIDSVDDKGNVQKHHERLAALAVGGSMALQSVENH